MQREARIWEERRDLFRVRRWFSSPRSMVTPRGRRRVPLCRLQQLTRGFRR